MWAALELAGNSNLKIRNYKNKKARRVVGSLNLGLHHVKMHTAYWFQRESDCVMSCKMGTSEFLMGRCVEGGTEQSINTTPICVSVFG
jgi:hypothetical protein